jgi:hypothetical protein
MKLRHAIAISVALQGLLGSANAAAAAAWTLRTLPEWHQARDDSPFAPALPSSTLARDVSRQELEVRSSPGRLDLIATARSTARTGSRPDNEAVLNQAAVDATVFDQHFGFGKKIFSWDVGFGFRPLDLIEQENRRAVYPTTLEGVPYVSWESFSADSSVLFLYANPGRGRSGDAFNEESLAVKAYARRGGADLYAIGRISRRFGVEMGAAFSDVVSETTEVHASLLYQQRYERRLDRLANSGQVLAATDPLETRRFAHGGKALLGMTWSTAQGTSLIGEAWYDLSAHTPADWRAAAELARRQQALLAMPGVPAAAVLGNLAYTLRYFDDANPMRGNLMLRASRHEEGSDWEAALDALYTPADGGYVSTVSLGCQRDRYRVDTGLRYYGGPQQAAYRLLPERRVAYLALRFSF